MSSHTMRAAQRPADRCTAGFPGLWPLVQGIATRDAGTTRRAAAGLDPVLQAVYDQGETAWRAGAPADFLAATLYASPRFYLRLHAHAPGATDTDLHTHKGTVYSTVLSGALTNTTAHPDFTANRPERTGLDVWRCACLADGSHARQRTGASAVVNPGTIRADRLTAGRTFTVLAGDYHRLAISRNPVRPTVTLCLFEWSDPHAPDAFVLTGRPTPVVADRDMTATAARAAVRHLLDTGTPGLTMPA